MAGPIPAAATQVAQQATQQSQTMQQNLPQQPKTGASKFDQALAQRAEGGAASQQAGRIHASEILQSLQRSNPTTATQKAGSVDPTKATQRDAPVAHKEKSSVITNMLTQVETRNANMGKFINDAMGGKLKLSQQQLLGLQAKVSEYSLELDLTGKVVEKATNGLKDTLRTQV